MHALAIAASSASGLKETSARWSSRFTTDWRRATACSRAAREAGLPAARAPSMVRRVLHALDSERADLAGEAADLGRRWEILDTGVTVKLYPRAPARIRRWMRCSTFVDAGTLRADDVDRIEIEVDAIVPTILPYDRPVSALEAKFSMPFCAAAAVVFGRVGIDTLTMIGFGIASRRR
jgi:2-methylcitrate dehydratase PrpD